MKYYTNTIALDKIRRHCSNNFGFEYAFAQATKFLIYDLIDCIDSDVPVHRTTYDEPVDFLDGNGFSVKKFMDNLYILQYLYEEEPQ